MTDTPTDKGPSFVTREPVVTAGGSTVGAVGLAYAIMRLAEAFDWQHFTKDQSEAIIGVVVIIVGLGSSLLAAQKVTPQHEVERQVLEAWVAEPPVADVPHEGVPVNMGGRPVGAPEYMPATLDYSMSYGDRLVSDAIAAQQLAAGLDRSEPTANIDDIDPPHMAGAILDGTIADPFAT